MSRLVFEADDVRRVVEHSLAAPEQRPIAYTKDKPVIASSVILVHDDGIYLMSNGKPGDEVSMTRVFVAYARGCNPDKDPAFWDEARQLVGGDDFAETLPWANQMKRILDAWAKTIVIRFSPRSISLVERRTR